MAGFYVCNGATCECTSGTTPATLIVTSQAIASINAMTVATVMDYVTEMNVPSFGTCSVLTAAASGVSTPCVPVTAAPWTPGSVIRTITDMAILTQESMLTCTVGGVISITEPNNEIGEGD